MIAALVVVNLALQLFDGAATYVGWEHFGEANPLLRAGFERWGAGPTLLTAKLFASAALFWMACVPRRILATLGLSITASAYAMLSFIPWSIRFLT